MEAGRKLMIWGVEVGRCRHLPPSIPSGAWFCVMTDERRVMG